MAHTGYIKELKPTLLLAAPITAGQLSQMILGITDTLMIGRVGVVPLAGSALAHTLFHFLFMVGIGTLSSVSVLVSHAYGAGDRKDAGETLRRGMALALVGGFLLFLILWSAFPFLEVLKQPPEVLATAKPYLWLMGVSMPVVMGIITLRNYSEAQDAPWPAFWAGLAAVLLNVFLNWVFIFGHLGVPAMGLTGAGIATLISRVFNLVVLFYWLKGDRRFTESWPVKWLAPIPRPGLLYMIRLGLPVGMQLLAEVGAFASTTLLMGLLGVVEMASHQIALTCAATTFMFPLGISLAVAIRVGHVIGASQPQRARVVAFGAGGFNLVLAGIFTALFILCNQLLARAFTPDPATVRMAASLLVVAGIFQIFDGTQVMAAGSLRGCKDVRVPTWIIIGSYWGVAIPLAMLLGFTLEMGAVGLWIGLAIGLLAAAVGLVSRFVWITGKLTSMIDYWIGIT